MRARTAHLPHAAVLRGVLHEPRDARLELLAHLLVLHAVNQPLLNYRVKRLLHLRALSLGQASHLSVRLLEAALLLLNLLLRILQLLGQLLPIGLQHLHL